VCQEFLCENEEPATLYSREERVSVRYIPIGMHHLATTGPMQGNMNQPKTPTHTHARARV
jgi:hypothetical protein